MLRTIIIDDEPKGRSALQQMLQKFCPAVEVLETAESAEAGKKIIQQHKPDLVFLDVEMPFQDGFEMLQSMEKIDFKVIFCTGHNHYAIKAIRFSALDYLMKPIDIKELKAAVEKAEHSIRPKNSNEQFDVFFHNLKNVYGKIGVPTRNGLLFVEINNILRCESDSNYTRIYTLNGEKHIASKTLKEFEGLLTECNFVRIHQSHLVNLNHIKEYVKGDGGSVILVDGTEVEVSRKNKDVLLKRLMTH